MTKRLNLSLRAAFAAVCLSLGASVANAAVINFNVDRSWANGTNTYASTDGSVSVNVDGVRVNHSGTILDTENFYTASWSGRNGGVGVYDCSRAGRRSCAPDNPMIDGQGPDEFAVLDFGDLTVEVASVTFSYWDRRDTFAFGIYEDTTLPATAQIYQQDIDEGDSNPYTHMFSTGQVVGSIIGFGVDSWHDDFRLQSISFNVVSAVPLPAGLALMLTGLGGLGLMRRRRRRA